MSTISDLTFININEIPGRKIYLYYALIGYPAFFMFLKNKKEAEMLPTDPKEAAKLGKAWGEVLTESIFGVTDLFKNRKGMKEAANKKMQLQNQRTLIKNAKIKAENAKKLQEEEARLLMGLSAADKEKYFKDKAALAKSAAKAEQEAAEAAEERGELLVLLFVVAVVLPAVVWLFLAAFAVLAKASGDYSTYHTLSKILPGF